MLRTLCIAVLSGGLAVAPGSIVAREEPNDFEARVQPILAAKCLKCHGPGQQESGVNLADPGVLQQVGDSGERPIIPGHADESELVRRIRSDDADVRMPPDAEPLIRPEIDILTDWIDQGANWPDHWAYRELHGDLPMTVLPATLRDWCRNPIDCLIAARLADHQLAPALPASARVLVRRLYFDLLGMPPTRDEVEAFVADQAPLAYERLVDRLLASPRYGERWARHWMDLVHFAETHGHDQDRPREHAWPYRDYLIRSFNDDIPYPTFVRQQVAGDVLFADDPWSIVATGLLAAGPWDESSLRDIQEDSVDREIARYIDRDDIVTTVMTTFNSTSVHCARCHDHKFDPISQHEYYGLQAVFAGIGKGTRPYDVSPHVARRRRELTAQRDTIAQWRQSGDMSFLTPEIEAEISAWEAARDQERSIWHELEWEDWSSAAGTKIEHLDDGSFRAEGTRPDKDVYRLFAARPFDRVTAIRLELIPDAGLPQLGSGRADNGNLHLNQVRVFWQTEGTGRELPIVAAQADFNQEGWAVSQAIDGNPNTAWGIHPQETEPHVAVFQVEDNLPRRDKASLGIELHQIHGDGHLIGRFRLLATAEPEPLRRTIRVEPAEIQAVLKVSKNRRSDAQRMLLATYVLELLAREQLDALPEPALVYCGTSRFLPDASFRPPEGPQPVMVLRRGMIDAPIEPARPAGLSCLKVHSGELRIDDPLDEGQRRAALANWLASPDNALSSRSIVNRLWQYHFGRGLVETPNDFGRMGASPTHPRLLDWLARALIDHGSSLKAVQRLIVTSATYRQSTTEHDQGHSIDAENRLLWRFNRRRLDAESLRDALLVFAGQLDLTMGGPSERHFIQSPGIHVTPVVDYGAFDVSGQQGMRRSVYRFVFRTIPDPFMEALDCPDASQLTGKRGESITPLQALATLNDRFVIHQCEQIAQRIECTDRDRTDATARAFTLLIGRPPDTDELHLVEQYAREHGLANTCRFLVNSNEFMFLE
jgi:hypothetical protein